jgi:hypothetical protein
VLLRVLHHAFSLTPLAKPPGSLKSGYYGEPPHWSWWLKQSCIYFLGLLGMKLCVYVLFQMLPWLAWVGDWALKWTEGNAALQIVFVMLIFPLIMNALQYYIVDSFIKEQRREDDGSDPAGRAGSGQHPEDDAGEREGLIAGEEGEEGHSAAEERQDEQHKAGSVTRQEEEPLKEANPTPLATEQER